MLLEMAVGNARDGVRIVRREFQHALVTGHRGRIALQPLQNGPEAKMRGHGGRVERDGLARMAFGFVAQVKQVAGPGEVEVERGA